jgi:hypothetical protein
LTTVKEKIEQKAKHIEKWQKENPGLSWVTSEHPQNEPKIYITHEILNSKAFRSLSRNGHLLLLDFLSKRRMVQGKSYKKKVWVCENNGNIIFPYSEAKERGFTATQMRNGIDELQSKGFIDIAHQGQGGRAPAKGAGDPTRYWIDDRWKEYGTPDFMPPKNPRVKDNKQDRGFQRAWKDPVLREQMLKKRSNRK